MKCDACNRPVKRRYPVKNIWDLFCSDCSYLLKMGLIYFDKIPNNTQIEKIHLAVIGFERSEKIKTPIFPCYICGRKITSRRIFYCPPNSFNACFDACKYCAEFIFSLRRFENSCRKFRKDGEGTLLFLRYIVAHKSIIENDRG